MKKKPNLYDLAKNLLFISILGIYKANETMLYMFMEIEFCVACLIFKKTLLYFCIVGFGEVKEVVLMRDKSRVDLLLIVVFILAIVILLVEIKTASRS